MKTKNHVQRWHETDNTANHELFTNRYGDITRRNAKHRESPFLMLLLAVFLLCFGCKKRDLTDNASPPDNTPPVVADTLKVNGTPVLKPMIKVYLITDDGQPFVKMLNDSTLILSKVGSIHNITDSQMIVTSINRGDYLVADQGTNLPYGLLVKIQSSKSSGDEWTLGFSSVGLDEIFDRLDLDWHFNLPAITENILKDIEIPVSGTSGNKLSVRAGIFLSLNNRLAFKIQDSKVENANLTSYATTFTTVDVNFLHTGVISTSKELYSKDYEFKKSAKIKIGNREYEFPLGLTVGVRVGVYIDGSGKLHLAGQLLNHTGNANLKIEYNGQEWHSEGKYDGQHNPTLSQFKLNGKFKAGVSGDLTFRFYYPVVNTSSMFGLDVYGRLEGKCLQDKGVTITGYGGVNGYLKGTIDLFSFKVYDPNPAIIPLSEQLVFSKTYEPDPAFCGPEEPDDSAGTRGDTHVWTLDNRYYDLQAAREFQLLKSSYNGFEIQTRQSKIPNVSSKQVTFNTAMAFQCGSDRVHFQMNPVKLYVNGQEKDSNTVIPLSGNGSITRTGNTISFQLYTGDRIKIIYYSRGYFDIKVSLIKQHKGLVSGLLGNWDGNPKNDVQTKDGIAINPNDFNAMRAFADSWQVTNSTSLFVYEPGTSTETFTDLSYPSAPFTPSTQQFTSAETICRNAGVSRQPALCDCITDIAVTENPAFVESSQETQKDLAVDDLIAYFPFDGDSHDESNYGNHGTIIGDLVPTTDRHNKSNGALAFNTGTSTTKGYVTVPNTPTIMGLTKEFTLAAWVLFQRWDNGWGSVICKSEGEQTRVQLQLRQNRFGFNASYTSLSSAFVYNQWNHFAVVVKDGRVQYFFNGVKIDEKPADGLGSNTSPLSIGKDRWGSVEYHYGKMDEVRIYSRALTTSEIQELYLK